MSRTKRKEAPNGSELTEEIRHVPKKLKLIIRERNIYAVLDELEKAGDISTALSLLFEISSFYPLKPKDAEITFQRLLQYYRMISPAARSSSSSSLSTDESAWLDVKLKMVETLRKISKSGSLTSHASGSITPSTAADSPDGLMNLVLDHIADEDEPECVSALFLLACDFQHYLSCDSPAFKRMITVCRQSLANSQWSVRTSALQLLTRSILRQRQLRREILVQPTDNSSTVSIRGGALLPVVDDLESILCKFTDDNDGRVRSAAAECLLDVFKSGWALPRQQYELVCRLSKDPTEAVRRLGLRLVHIYASTPAYVDTLVATGASKDVEIRLIDHAFSTLCNSMHDLSVAVRTEAATLLGTLKDVSEKFLEQTLDKKLMSKMRFVKSSGLNRYGQQQGGLSEWSSGRKFGEDAPMEKTEEESESLMPSGACGAFVTGLEDEYLSVRNASVNAVSNLAASCPAFAQNALDFIADMFNDEIEEVRLNAIQSLRRLCSHIVLKVEQMEVILNALDDASADSRDALRELLCMCRMSDVPCLRMTGDALLNNLKRYPSDRHSIWRCMKYLGMNHAALAIPFVTDLLDLHPFFETSEPDLDDPFYIAKLILVLNVASKCPPVKALFVGHTWRHYHYLRTSNPHLVPNLDIVTETSNIALDKNAELRIIDQAFTRCQRLLSSIEMLPTQSKWDVMKLVIEDLKRLAGSISGMANEDEEEGEEETTTISGSNARWRTECLRYSAENIMKMETLLHRLKVDGQGYERVSQSSSSTLSSMTVELKEIVKSSIVLEHLWKTIVDSTTESGGKQDITALALNLRLRAAAALMTLDLNGDDPDDGNRWMAVFSSTLQRLSRHSNDPWISELTDLAENMGNGDKATSAEIIQRLSNVPLSSALKSSETSFTDSMIRRKRATIVEPEKHNDTVVRFVAGLAACIKLTANFYDLDEDDLKHVRIRVLYPDQREEFLKPRLSHFRRISTSLFRLRTDVLVSDTTWSDPARIELSLVYRMPSEMVNVGDQEDKMNPMNWINLDSSGGYGVSLKMYPKGRC